ncbi:hypothetical protein EDD11_009150 [Mortierella claussenii]|nr:hypothetical protein EDD11_009150 [Mortierella claussenii]
MVSSKPLPPIPAPAADKERRSHLFSSAVTHLKRKSETVAGNPATVSAAAPVPVPVPAPAQGHEPQQQIQQQPLPYQEADAQQGHATDYVLAQPQPKGLKEMPKSPPADSSSFSSIFSSFMVSTGLAAPKAASIRSNRPSRSTTPAPPTDPLSAAQPDSTSTPTTTTMGAAIIPTESLSDAHSGTALPVVGARGMVSLDQRSFQHLRAIARQSIASSCLEPEILWLRLFMDMMHKLATNAADAWVQVEAAHEAFREARRAEDGGAMTQTTTTINGNTATEQDKDKEVWDRPALSYSIRLKKHISSNQECSFTVGRFEGESILLEERSIMERRRPPKEGQKQVLLGGTIFLSAGPDDLPKAEKILELLVFALCSLQLEAYLMRDHDVVRPDHALSIPTAHEGDAKLNKALAPVQQSNLGSSKRASKGSMFFGWLSRGTVPAKYKRGTTQLAQDSDTGKSDQVFRLGPPGINSSIAEDFGMTEDFQNIQSYRFAKIIQQVEKAIISVSPDIVFPPPHLLLRLRDEEAVGPDSKRKSYTWEDVEFVARKIGFGNRVNRTNMTGASQTSHFGTVKSNISNITNSTQLSKTNRLPIDSRAGLEHLMTNSNSLQGIFNHQSISFSYSYYWSATAAAPCNPPNMITVEYYRKEGQYEDMGLGEMIEYICKRANSSCLDKTCEHKRLEHISTYTHGEARINITVEQPRPDSATDFDSEEFTPFLSNNRTIAVWTRCKMCRVRTKPRELSRASRLYSFGKYLELLLYAQHFEPGPRPLCDHVVTKDSVVRCFLYRGLVMSFEYESIDLFEMRISRLQVHEDFPAMPRFDPGETDENRRDYSIASSSTLEFSPRQSTATSVSLNCDYFTDKEQARVLDTTRLEIMHFYESCKRIIVVMEQHLGETKSISKHINNSKVSSGHSALDPKKKVALDRLDELGESWKADEFDLYDQLKRLPIARLNDLRNRFRDSIKRTMRLMEAWQKEHHPESLKAPDKESVEWVLPEYFNQATLHTFPGSSVMVREDEPSSIIASTLSSSDYLSLISSLFNHDNDPLEPEEKAPQPPQKDYPFNTLSVPARLPLKSSRSDGSVTLVGRKGGSTGSDASTAMSASFNGIATQNDPSGGENCHNRDGDDDDDDEEEEDEDQEDDSFLVVDGYQTSVKFLQVSKVDFSSLISNGTMSPRSTIGLHFGRHNKTSTLGVGAAATEKKSLDPTGTTRPFSMMALPNSTPVLVDSPLSTPDEKPSASSFFISPPETRSTTPTPGGKSKGGTFGYHSLTSGLSGTMKGLSLNALSDKIGNGFASYNSASGFSEKAEKDTLRSDASDRTMRGEGLMIERETGANNRSPHIKARFSHGKTSFSCVTYYAAEFDTLRRRCGIHQIYVKSLSRCNSWSANGGKSKSSFYKTKDDRFVIKQMVSSWNIAEKDELLKFAPKYFEYMENSHEAPTILAKIFGFYTLKVKNRDSGQVLKIDVLVMEHLFYNQKITRTFDLKGIQDRHVGSKPQAGNGGSTTLWDGDFIEGRYKALLLLHSHSKKIIRESLLNDTEFLAGANIMDYSLLVGVDDERKELVVGIVDFIGAYTWYKRIESKGKTTLRGAKDSVTVLPPQQYKIRFQEAMERYFLAVPDKWSKTAVEQEQEARREATNAMISSTIPEGSKENSSSNNSSTLGTPSGTTSRTPELERSLKNKTSGYLEKISKVILSAKSADTMASIVSVTSPVPTIAAPPNTAVVGTTTTAGRGADGKESLDNKPMEATSTTATTAVAIVNSELRIGKLPRVFHPLD